MWEYERKSEVEGVREKHIKKKKKGIESEIQEEK